MTLNAIRAAVRAGYSVHIRDTLDQRDDGLVIDLRWQAPDAQIITYRFVLTAPQIDSAGVDADQLVADVIQHSQQQLDDRRT